MAMCVGQAPKSHLCREHPFNFCLCVCLIIKTTVMIDWLQLLKWSLRNHELEYFSERRGILKVISMVPNLGPLGLLRSGYSAPAPVFSKGLIYLP